VIRYELPRSEAVSLTIYNIAGRVVRALLDSEEQGIGVHGLTWDGRDDRGHRVPAGVYYYRLDAGDRSMTREMILVD
jgi:flagellar hook assembly protein FlgD